MKRQPPVPVVRRVDDRYGYCAAFDRHDRAYDAAVLRGDQEAAKRHALARKAIAGESW